VILQAERIGNEEVEPRPEIRVYAQNRYVRSLVWRSPARFWHASCL
jgi:hypothetical protein